MQRRLSIPDPDQERPLFEVMFRAALHGARGGLAGGLVFAALLAWIFWPQRGAPAVQAWFATLLALVAVRAALFRHWARLPDAGLGRPQARATTALYLLTGVVWGSAGWVFNAAGPEWARYALLAGQYTMLVMSVVALSWYLPAFVAFATPASILIPVPWVLQVEHVGVIVALGTLFNYLAWMSFAGRHASIQAESIRTRFERENLVRQLAQHARDMELAHQAKTRFLAAASHDLSQPLHAMALVLSNARQQGKGLAAAALPAMQAMVRSLDEILESVIEAARLEGAQSHLAVQLCDPQALVDQAVEELAPLAEQAGLIVRVHRHDGMCMSHPGSLLRIVRNLLSNALKYTRCGGVLVAVRERDASLRIEVWDTGSGIAPPDLERIFEPFQRADTAGAPGAGLGLAVVRQLCADLGHHVEVRSRPGRGSVFRVTLGSRAHPPARHIDDSAAGDAVLAAPQMLLLVRDRMLALHLAALLRHWELRWQLDDDPAAWAETLQDAGARHALALIEAEAGTQQEGLRTVAAGTGIPCIWLGASPPGAAPTQVGTPALVRLPLPIEPVALHAAINRLVQARPGAALPRWPASASSP